MLCYAMLCYAITNKYLHLKTVGAAPAADAKPSEKVMSINSIGDKYLLQYIDFTQVIDLT